LLKQLRLRFATVRHAKPESSRKGSAETFLVATGFKG
jgi:23S rRNA (uridine2552-2'-O)-methyltransferase